MITRPILFLLIGSILTIAWVFSEIRLKRERRMTLGSLGGLVGTSGSGKSSLVRCGLLSHLLGGKMLRAGTLWQVAVTHPGAAPLSLRR